jgi:hypothetical protein
VQHVNSLVLSLGQLKLLLIDCVHVEAGAMLGVSSMLWLVRDWECSGGNELRTMRARLEKHLSVGFIVAPGHLGLSLAFSLLSLTLNHLVRYQEAKASCSRQDTKNVNLVCTTNKLFVLILRKLTRMVRNEGKRGLQISALDCMVRISPQVDLLDGREYDVQSLGQVPRICREHKVN